MKISIEIIKEHLNHYEFHTDFKYNSSTFNLIGHQFIANTSEFSSDILYILDDENFTSFVNLEGITSLIYIGSFPQNHINSNINIIFLKQEIDLIQLINDISNIFILYNNWEYNIQKYKNKLNPLQYLVNISEPIFGNGISIMNSDFFLLAESPMNITAIKYKKDASNFISIEQVNEFKNDPDYREISRKKEVFFYPDDHLPYKCFCKNFFSNNNFVFRIIISNTNRSLRPIDSQLLEFLSTYIENITEAMQASQTETHPSIVPLLKKLLEGSSYDYNLLLKGVKDLRWDKSSKLFIIVIEPSSHDFYTETINYFCSRITKDYPQTFSFTFHSRIIVIVNSSFNHELNNDFISSFNKLIRESNFRAGISLPTNNIRQLNECYIQSIFSLNKGQEINPSFWLHKFSDYIFHYIFDRITSEISSEFIYSSSISKILSYDGLNQTEYFKTLKTYLRNNMNALQTSRDLFIHRATILYRLERLKEIGKINFENHNELLHLYLTLNLMELNSLDEPK